MIEKEPNLPLVARACPCGDPEHWMVKYEDYVLLEGFNG